MSKHLIRYGSMSRGKFHVPAPGNDKETLCGRKDEGLSHCVLAAMYRSLALREDWVCRRCVPMGKRIEKVGGR
jgi:hypothetical protein